MIWISGASRQKFGAIGLKRGAVFWFSDKLFSTVLLHVLFVILNQSNHQIKLRKKNNGKS